MHTLSDSRHLLQNVKNNELFTSYSVSSQLDFDPFQFVNRKLHWFVSFYECEFIRPNIEPQIKFYAVYFNALENPSEGVLKLRIYFWNVCMKYSITGGHKNKQFNKQKIKVQITARAHTHIYYIRWSLVGWETSEKKNNFSSVNQIQSNLNVSLCKINENKQIWREYVFCNNKNSTKLKTFNRQAAMK